jgi:hypothetical protein
VIAARNLLDIGVGSCENETCLQSMVRHGAASIKILAL